MTDKTKALDSHYSVSLNGPSMAFGWSHRTDQEFRFAVGSCVADRPNDVTIYRLQEDSATDKFGLNQVTSFQHPYPATGLQFVPGFTNTNEDILAMASDQLYLYHVHHERPGTAPRLIHKLANPRSKFSAISSFDWNPLALSNIVCAGSDGILTLWDVVGRSVVYDLYAHSKKPCYQVSWEPRSMNTFASCGGDGTLRYFDRRSSDTCHMLFKVPDGSPPIARFSFNEELPYYIACAPLMSDQIFVLDTRQIRTPVAVLRGHSRAVNAVSWAKGIDHILASGADDGLCMLWSVSREHARAASEVDFSHQSTASSIQLSENRDLSTQSSNTTQLNNKEPGNPTHNTGVHNFGSFRLDANMVSPDFRTVNASGVIETPVSGVEYANPVEMVSWCPYNPSYVGVIEGEEFHMLRY